MEKNYKYRLTSAGIAKHEVVKETPNQIHYYYYELLKKEAKVSSWASWHDTFEDAKSQLIKETEGKIQVLKIRIAYEEKYLLRYRELKEEQN